VEQIRRLGDLYAVQWEVVRRWRHGRRAQARRVVISFAVGFIALWFTAWVVPGLTISRPLATIAAVVVVCGLNLLVRPLLVVLVAGRSVVGVGLLAVAFQTLVFVVLDELVPGVSLAKGVVDAFVVSLVFALTNTVLSSLVQLGDEQSYYGALARALAGRGRDVVRTDEPGLVVIQIDGLSYDVLAHAMRAGRTPVMAGWVRSGGHRLGHWEALLPSSTPASQSGILHGANDGVPNFRWWDKGRSRLVVVTHPEDATEIEAHHSTGAGLLSPGGTSINNLFTGDAARSFLVMSTIKVPGRGLGDSEAFGLFFLSPYSYFNMLARFLGEVAKELWQARRAAAAGLEPRLDRGFPYPWLRALTNVVLRTLGTSLVMGEMMRGTPVVYIDYTDYDEISHHTGPERPESLDALDGVDRELGRLALAAADAARPYRFVVVADHGQTLSTTFLQRYGVRLEDVVRSLMAGQASVAAATAQVEGWGPLNALVSELARTRGITGGAARLLSRRHGRGGLGPSAVREPARPATAGDGARDGGASAAPADLVVAAGGNLAHVYFTASQGRLLLEDLERLHPGLAAGLASHPGIGAVLVRSRVHGLVALGGDGTRFVDEDRVEGVDPLAVYEGNALAAVRRLDGLAHVGDLIVISLYDPETWQVAAFEELVGAHGGLGGPQTRPFLLYPADWQLDLAPLVGAPMVHQQLRRWMEGELGMTFPAGRPAAATRDGTGGQVIPPAGAPVGTDAEGPG
jgi:uncharacterized membrane protein YvlD (DUF360 family)